MIDGKLIRLRPPEPADSSLMVELANNPQVRANVVGWDWPLSHHGQAEWLNATLHHQTTRRLIVADLASGDPVGVTGLWDIDWRNRSALTAVKLMPEAAPPGAGTDSIMLTMAWAFHEVGLRRLHSSILSYNAASIGAYVRKCGWSIEGTSREAVFRHGVYNDLLQVGMLRTEFDRLEDAKYYVDSLYATRTG